jgi:hypothetical protein
MPEILLSNIPQHLWWLALLLAFLWKPVSAVIERYLPQKLDPQAALRRQLEEIRQDIATEQNAQVQKALLYRQQQLLIEYHFGLTGRLSVTEPWLLLSEVHRQDGFTLTQLQMMNSYLDLSPKDHLPQLRFRWAHHILTFFSLIAVIVCNIVAAFLVTLALVTIVNGNSAGLIALVVAAIPWYIAGRNADVVFYYVNARFVMQRQVDQKVKRGLLSTSTQSPLQESSTVQKEHQPA